MGPANPAHSIAWCRGLEERADAELASSLQIKAARKYFHFVPYAGSQKSVFLKNVANPLEGKQESSPTSFLLDKTSFNIKWLEQPYCNVGSATFVDFALTKWQMERLD